MPPLPLCEPGAVVSVRYRETRQTTGKRRPAIVLTDAAYHAARADAIMVPLSTKAGGYYGDCAVNDWRAAGLNMATTAKGVIQTLERSAVERRIGTLSESDFGALKSCLRTTLGL